MAIRKGATVKATHKGMLDDGTVFDQSTADNPLEFQADMGLLLDGLEREIGEMQVGEKKTFTLKDYEAFGEYLEHMIDTIPKEMIPGAERLKVGDVRWMLGEDGNKFPATVKEVGANDIVLDMNHPLAGKAVTYEVEILEIDESTAMSDKEIELEEAKRKHFAQGGALGEAGMSNGTVML